MLRRPLSRFKNAYHYSKMMGFKELIILKVLERLNKKSLRLINIANEQFYIRTATTDFKIAITCLVTEEYGNLECSNPSVIIDAGANIGASSVYFAKKYPKAKIFAIEPEQENFDILKKNIEKYTNIVPIKVALWDNQEIKTIQDSLNGSWGFSICETDNKVVPTNQQVDCITIGSLMNKYDLEFIDILKMDIEGSEKKVFENAEDWINKVGIITVELHERICIGCLEAFNHATRDFIRFEKNGEKITAYRK